MVCDINSITRTSGRMTTFKILRESSENKHTNETEDIKYQGFWNQNQTPNPKWSFLFLQQKICTVHAFFKKS